MTIALRYKAHNPLLKVKQLHLKMKIPKNIPILRDFYPYYNQCKIL